MSTARAFDALSSLPAREVYTHWLVYNTLQTACYALYCYDHLLVFSDEVEQFWTRRFNIASLLYILNRYPAHILFITMHEGLYPEEWTTKQCNSFTIFRGACTIFVFGIAQTTMILRAYALYGRNLRLLGGFLAVLATQTILMGMCVGTANAYIVGRACVAVGGAPYYGALWLAPLATDTLIFVAMLLRIRAYRAAQLNVPMAQQICHDGAGYFLIILCGNMVNLTVCCAWAVREPDAAALLWSDLTTIGTPFTQVITSLMVARLQLDLRSRQGALRGLNERQPPPFFALANLGGEIEVRRGSFDGRREYLE